MNIKISGNFWAPLSGILNRAGLAAGGVGTIRGAPSAGDSDNKTVPVLSPQNRSAVMLNSVFSQRFRDSVHNSVTLSVTVITFKT